jgi:RimJ/RimL family protein N-acetyltransferase
MIERFETERLVLRPITTDDVDLLVELDSDPEVMRFLTGGEPSSRAHVTERVARSLGHRWIAYERATGAFIGWFALRLTSDGVRELGYRLRKGAWGKGYATEGSTALLALAFTELGADRVYAQTMTVNTRSRAVMERCGLRFVRTFHGDWEPKFAGSELDDVEYEITRAQWQARSAGS